MDDLLQAAEARLSEETGALFRVAGKNRLGGGCIHDATRLRGEDGRFFFLKRNRSEFAESFRIEAEALGELHAAGGLRVPQPYGVVESGGEAALLLEYLPMGGGTGKARYEDLGRGLAKVHETRKTAFGWHRDNWIGSTPQYNGFEEDWVAFLREKRLRPQIEWARERGLRLCEAEALLAALPAFFESYAPEPSLLHGDLWAGNVEFMDDGTPVIFDPATYYGDRETDLAMTEMFGGFPAAFWKAYEAEWPIDHGYRRRRDLYNLYHLLNHYNLFGGGYGGSAERTVASLLRASGS